MFSMYLYGVFSMCIQIYLTALLAQSSNIVSWKIIPCGALNNIEKTKE